MIRFSESHPREGTPNRPGHYPGRAETKPPIRRPLPLAVAADSVAHYNGQYELSSVYLQVVKKS